MENTRRSVFNHESHLLSSLWAFEWPIAEVPTRSRLRSCRPAWRAPHRDHRLRCCSPRRKSWLGWWSAAEIVPFCYFEIQYLLPWHIRRSNPSNEVTFTLISIVHASEHELHCWPLPYDIAGRPKVIAISLCACATSSINSNCSV